MQTRKMKRIEINRKTKKGKIWGKESEGNRREEKKRQSRGLVKGAWKRKIQYSKGERMKKVGKEDKRRKGKRKEEEVKSSEEKRSKRKNEVDKRIRRHRKRNKTT